MENKNFKAKLQKELDQRHCEWCRKGKFYIHGAVTPIFIEIENLLCRNREKTIMLMTKCDNCGLTQYFDIEVETKEEFQQR